MGSHVSTQAVPTMAARAQVMAARPAVKARKEKQLCAMLDDEAGDAGRGPSGAAAAATAPLAMVLSTDAEELRRVSVRPVSEL